MTIVGIKTTARLFNKSLPLIRVNVEVLKEQVIRTIHTHPYKKAYLMSSPGPIDSALQTREDLNFFSQNGYLGRNKNVPIGPGLKVPLMVRLTII